MSRNRKRRRDPVALVICRDAHHHDEHGYAERGHHVVGELVPVPSPGADDQYHLEWTGNAPERGPLRLSGLTIGTDKPAGFPPVKSYRRSDGIPVWRVRCSCGDDRQRSEPDIIAIITGLQREFPDRPCKIPMSRL